jgi:hypothetical protein
MESEDLMAAAALLVPAAVLYSYSSHTAAIVAGLAGTLAAFPLVLFPPRDGRRGYARLLAWLTWLWEPRRCDPATAGEAKLQPIYIEEVRSDGRRGRRFLLPDPPARPQ